MDATGVSSVDGAPVDVRCIRVVWLVSVGSSPVHHMMFLVEGARKEGFSYMADGVVDGAGEGLRILWSERGYVLTDGGVERVARTCQWLARELA